MTGEQAGGDARCRIVGAEEDHPGGQRDPADGRRRRADAVEEPPHGEGKEGREDELRVVNEQPPIPILRLFRVKKRDDHPEKRGREGDHPADRETT